MRRRRFGGFPQQTTTAEVRSRSSSTTKKLEQKGQALEPVTLESSAIARTFWGKAWCSNLEYYGDYANRLPRGRTYVRHGAVIDLRISSQRIQAQVSGTRLYQVAIEVDAISDARKRALASRCAGRIDSVVELLKGELSRAVMELISERGQGLFPEPREIHFSCSCPDWARMCKHVAATLYGVGARLDRRPDLLFLLRGIEPLDLVGQITPPPDPVSAAPAPAIPAGSDLGALFGIELEQEPTAPRRKPAPRKRRPRAEPVRTLEALVEAGVDWKQLERWLDDGLAALITDADGEVQARLRHPLDEMPRSSSPKARR